MPSATDASGAGGEEGLERWAGAHRLGYCLVVFLAGLGLRLLAASLIGRFVGQTPEQLALMFDGHVYILIARSFPRPYEGIHEFFPAFRDSTYFTGWFPLYPLAIALLKPLAGGWELAALFVSRVAGALCAPLLFLLAERRSRRPALAAALFAILPGTWLLTGSLAFVEPLFVLVFLAAILALDRERSLPAVLLCALTALAQKTGVLVLPIALAVHGARSWRRAGPALGAILGLGLLLCWQAALFGDPWIGARVQLDLFGGPAWGLPLSAVLRGLAGGGDLVGGHVCLRKLAVALSLAFYCSALFWGLRHRARADKLALCWLGVVLAFYSTINFPWGYVAWGRYMVLAAPAAILLVSDALTRAQARAAVYLLPLAAPLALGWSVVEGVDGARRVRGNWPPGYFEALSERLR